MAVENLTATGYPSIYAPTVSQAGIPIVVKSTVEMTADASATSTYTMLKDVPSSIILIPELSYLYWDDLDNGGAPTLDLGIFGQNGSSITDDDNALLDGQDPTSAGSQQIPATLNATILTQELWDYVNGETADPEELFDIKVTLKDAAADQGGTIALQLGYWWNP